MLKGPFWVIGETDLDGNLSFGKLLACSVEVSQITPSHKDIWDFCRGNIKRRWNYYPRGRVEIRRGKAVVFANPICFEWAWLEDELRNHFHLGSLEINYKADNSRHYQCGVR